MYNDGYICRNLAQKISYNIYEYITIKVQCHKIDWCIPYYIFKVFTNLVIIKLMCTNIIDNFN